MKRDKVTFLERSVIFLFCNLCFKPWFYFCLKFRLQAPKLRVLIIFKKKIGI